MFRIVIFLLLVLSLHFSAFAGELNLKYSIKPVIEKQHSALEVTFAFQGSESGTTELYLPYSWAGQKELYTEISELHPLSTDVKIENTEFPDVKKVHHLPNEWVQIQYLVSSIDQKEGEWYYRPIVTDSYFFVFGHSLFIVPKADEETTTHLTLEWHDFPKSWALADSFGVDQTKQELTLPFGTFPDALFIGGDFEISQIGDPQAPVFVAVKKGWSFDQSRLTQKIESVITSQRDFWNDYEFPYYLVTVLPVQEGGSLGGTAVSNTFALFVGNLSANDKEDLNKLSWLLSHEHFHTWNGTKMKPSLPEGSLNWFSEGFTEYYALKLNYRSHLIDPNDYQEHINAILYEYYVSSAHHQPNDKIQQEMWKDMDVKQLPYIRGFLFALKWDQKIQRESHGKYSLDDVMYTLFERTQAQHLPLTFDDIEQVASQFLPPQEVQEDLNKYIVNGETIIPTENDVKNTHVEWSENVGFNLPQSLSKEKIVGVQEGSQAFEAGLRNGQRLVSYQSHGQQMVVSILDKAHKPKTITYLRESLTRLIPQYNRFS